MCRSHLHQRAVMRESAALHGDRLVSRLDRKLEPKATAVRRVEVITGGVGRRRWSEDEKSRAVEASLEPGAVVSAVARQHGVTPQQLFTWRREARHRAEQDGLADSFVPVVVVAAIGADLAREERPSPAVRTHSIELDVEGSSVVIWPGAEPGRVTAIIGALRVMVATRPVDFRKGADGLAALVREIMQADPFDGAIYLFRAKRADRLKLLFWDGTGVCLLAKRLEETTFASRRSGDGVMRLTSAQLSALLESLDWKRVRPAKDVSAPLLPG